MKKFLAFIVAGGFVATFFFSGCKKDALVADLHKDTTITGNQAPPYSGVTNLQIQSYINRMYVDLVGREPTPDEMNVKTNLLVSNNLSESARRAIVQELVTMPEYYFRFFELTSEDMTNGIDSVDIYGELYLLAYVRYLDSLSGITKNFFYYDYERGRLVDLFEANNDLRKGTIDIREFYRRFTDNYFYDQVNMGAENFVKGVFDDLFRRQPTESELLQGIIMYNGGPGELFLENGNDKASLERITTNSDEFIEGLVRKSYLQLLLRQPNSEEMSYGTTELKQSLDLPAFQKKIVVSKAYAGF